MLLRGFERRPRSDVHWDETCAQSCHEVSDMKALLNAAIYHVFPEWPHSSLYLLIRSVKLLTIIPAFMVTGLPSIGLEFCPRSVSCGLYFYTLFDIYTYRIL